MTISEFLRRTETRLPNPQELIALCEECGINFGFGADGKPVLKVFDGNKQVGELVAKLIRREPWRSEIIRERLQK